MFGKLNHKTLFHTWIGSILLLFFCFLSSAEGKAQQFPISSNLSIQPPLSPYLSDYGEVFSNVLLNVLLIENRPVSLRVRLRLRIESPALGIVIRTSDNFVYEEELVGGAPLILTSTQLADFFNPYHLDFQGVDRNQILKTKQLPESIYSFQFEVYEAESGRETLISNPDLGKYINSVWLVQPPIITLPLKDGIVNPQNLENIPTNFNWLRPANAPPNVEYNFFLAKLHDPVQSQSLNSATGIFSLGQPIYETTTFSQNIIYGNAGEPLLELGNIYAFQVQAVDPLGRNLFVNEGLSEVVVFQYGAGCAEVQKLQAEAQTHREIFVQWQSQSGQTDYTVLSRRVGSDKWYPTESQFTDAIIDDLEPNTEYEIKVVAACNALDSDASEIIRVRTLTPPEIDFTCGTPEEVIIENQEVKEGRLRIGDKFYSANFEILVTMVKPSESGKHSGIGWARIPAFQALQLVVEYENITLNTSNEHIGGIFYATRDDWYLYEPIEIAGGQNIQVSGNKISIRTGSGELRELPLGEKYVLSDPDWTYQVDEEGAVTYIPKEPVDYGEMTNQELLRETDRLKEEVAKSGNLKEAAKLTKATAELGKRGLDLLGEMIGFAKILLRSAQELLTEKEGNLNNKTDSLTQSQDKLNELANQINQKFESEINTNENIFSFGGNYERETSNVERERILEQPELRIYLEEFTGYLKQADTWTKIAFIYLVIEHYTKVENIPALEQFLKDTAIELFEKYQDEEAKLDADMEKQAKEDALVLIMKDDLKAFIQGFVEGELENILNNE